MFLLQTKVSIFVHLYSYSIFLSIVRIHILLHINKLLLNHLLGIYYFIRQTNNVIPVFNQVIRYDVVLIVVRVVQ